MPRMTPELIEEFLAQPYTAVIATLKRSGEPYTVPIVFLWEDGSFYFCGTYNRLWCKHLLRDPRMSINIEASQQGMEPHYGHVGAEGRAEAIEDKEQVYRVARKLFEKSPPDVPPEVQEGLWELVKATPHVAFRLRPDKLRAIDMSVYQGKRADREYQAAHGIDSGGRRMGPPIRKFTVRAK